MLSSSVLVKAELFRCLAVMPFAQSGIQDYDGSDSLRKNLLKVIRVFGIRIGELTCSLELGTS